MKYVKSFLEYFGGFTTFTANDAKLFLRKNGADKDYHKVFMHNLIGSGRVFRIKKGYYTLHDDLMTAGFAFSPFYYGLETVLTYNGLWDYVTPVSIITTGKAKSGVRDVLGRNVSVRRISKKMFFGYSMVKYENSFYIPMADIEKTLIDSVYFRALFNREVYEKMIGRIDAGKLGKYLESCPRIVRLRVEALMKEYKKAQVMVEREGYRDDKHRYVRASEATRI
jgi:hypothetical protein